MSRAPAQSPNATPARQRRKDARPQELRDAALALFVEQGFAATRIEDIAARAGVSKGTLYLYYASKEELFKAVVREHFSATISDGAVMLAQHQGTMAELLGYMMNRWWEKVGQGVAGGLTKVVMAEGRSLPELAQFYMDEVIEPTHRLLGSLIERGVASGEFRPMPITESVHVLIGPLLHMMLSEHSFGVCGDGINAPAVLKTQMDLMLRGMLCAAPKIAASPKERKK